MPHGDVSGRSVQDNWPNDGLEVGGCAGTVAQVALPATEPHVPSPTRSGDPSRDVAARGIVLVALILVAEITTHLVDYGVYGLRIRALNANLGSSPVAGISPLAVTIALVSALVLVRRGRAPVLLPLVLLLVLPLASGHLGESLPHWQVLLLPPLGLALLMLWREADELDPLAARACRAGCVLLVFAFVVHVFGAYSLHRLGVQEDSWPYQVKVALKEGFEISGWLLVAAGIGATAWASSRRTRATAL
jgi:hypothetical protein